MFAGVLGEKPETTYTSIYKKQKEKKATQAKPTYLNANVENLTTNRMVPPDPFQSVNISNVQDQNLAFPNHNVSNKYGAPPKQIILMEQFGLDGRSSVFPAGYLRFQNRINQDSQDNGFASDPPRMRGPPPTDYFASQNHRHIMEKPDKFDRSNTSWVSNLRCSDMKKEHIPPTSFPKSRMSTTLKATSKEKVLTNTRPSRNRRKSSRNLISNENHYDNRASFTHQVPVQNENTARIAYKIHRAAHKRWVPSGSTSMNGWIAGLRGEGSAHLQTKSRQEELSRERHKPREYRNMKRSERSWLRNCHEHAHLLKQSTNILDPRNKKKKKPFFSSDTNADLCVLVSYYYKLCKHIII